LDMIMRFTESHNILLLLSVALLAVLALVFFLLYRKEKSLLVSARRHVEMGLQFYDEDERLLSIKDENFRYFLVNESYVQVLEKRKEDFQAGIDAISKLTSGKTHLSVDKRSASFFSQANGVTLHKASGPHPAGNVGVHIHHIDPINAGERVWVINPEDVAIIGSLFKTGHYDPTRVVAVAGTEAPKAQYFRFKLGSNIKDIVGAISADVRIISGDVLTGTRITGDGFVGFYDNTITLIPEGDNYRMFGWLPFKDNNIPSMSKTSLSWLFPNKKYKVNTNLNGEERALVVTGEMEQVMPMDIYPMQLLKECMVFNIEKMENLGIYEVAPEDFALIDYVNTSKLEAQAIIREALDVMITEVG